MLFFDHDGLQLAYIDEPPASAAPGAPVLLIHGFASNHAVNWVNTGWVAALTRAGRRVIAIDNRGHGRSDKPHDPAAYDTGRMAGDAVALLDHLGVRKAVTMGYSMGARIAAFVARDHPSRVEAVILGGLGYRLVEGVGLPQGIAGAMEAASAADLSDPVERLFRTFAEQNGNDLAAMAACIRGSRQVMSASDVAAISCPALVAVGSKDVVAGDGPRLAALFPSGEALDIPGRDHNLAVGDKVHRQGVLDFLARLERRGADR